MMKFLRVWHPPLIGLMPILALYMGNRHEVAAQALLLPIAVMLVLSLTLWGILTWALKDFAKAGIVLSALLFVFFQFSTMAYYLNLWKGNYWTLLALLVLTGGGVLLVLGLWRLLRNSRAVQAATRWLNCFAVLVVAVQLAPLGMNHAKLARQRPTSGKSTASADSKTASFESGIALPTVAKPARLPDIYYLILDSYGRSDQLQAIYDYDNRAFLDHLKSRGFYVAGRSASNYCQTFLSLSSTLNCQYLDKLAESESSLDAWSLACAAMRHNSVVETLRKYDYKFVSFATNFEPTECKDTADVYLSPFITPEAAPNAFHGLLFDKTPLRLLSKAAKNSAENESYDKQRKYVRFVFDNLGRIAREHSPKFVLAHVLSPHPPFVFDENGAELNPEGAAYFPGDGIVYQHFSDRAEYIKGYRRQVIYVTKLAQRAIDEILDNSAEPPIILVQGDHGPGARWIPGSASPEKTDVKERLRILNAYYFPDGSKGLYEAISPVNSFRVLLNNYFGAKLELLPDKSYLSSLQEPFQFVDVSERVR